MSKPTITTITGQANNNSYQNNKANDELASSVGNRFLKDGSEPMTGDMDMNGFSINNVEEINLTGGSSVQNIVDECEIIRDDCEGFKDDCETVLLEVQSIADAFDDRYLGSFPVDPTTDNDGDPLTDGALYFNTTTDLMNVYDLSGARWIEIANMSLGGITDVTLTSPSTNEVLTFNGSVWVNSVIDYNNLDNLPTIPTALADLTDDATHRLTNDTDISKLAGIEAGAEVNNISDIQATGLIGGGNTELHHHDTLYYTESEMDTKLNAKANLAGATFTGPVSIEAIGANILRLEAPLESNAGMAFRTGYSNEFYLYRAATSRDLLLSARNSDDLGTTITAMRVYHDTGKVNFQEGLQVAGVDVVTEDGANFTGDVNISTGSTTARLELNSDVGEYGLIYFQAAGTTEWFIGKNNNDNFIISSRNPNDTGIPLSVINIDENTGVVNCVQGLQIGDVDVLVPTRFVANSTDVSNIANTSKNVTWNTERKKDSDFTHAADATAVYCNFDGEVKVRATIHVTGDNRVELITKVLLNGVAEANSLTANYALRDVDQNTGSVYLDYWMEVSNGDYIDIYAESDADGTSVLLATGTRLEIERVK